MINFTNSQEFRKSHILFSCYFVFMLDPNKLRVYSQAKELTNSVYAITKKFPVEEKYEIVNQIRRASASIGANIAEGCGRTSRADMRRFFHISLGSLLEVKYFLELSKMLQYLTDEEFTNLYTNANSLSKQLISFIKS